MIQCEAKGGLPLLSKASSQAFVEDQSANGTFLNGRRLVKGEQVPLRQGDRLSVVLSLSPMLERSFTVHFGEVLILAEILTCRKCQGAECLKPNALTWTSGVQCRLCGDFSLCSGDPRAHVSFVETDWANTSPPACNLSSRGEGEMPQASALSLTLRGLKVSFQKISHRIPQMLPSLSKTSPCIQDLMHVPLSSPVLMLLLNS